jgi:hypothetical protein
VLERPIEREVGDFLPSIDGGQQMRAIEISPTWTCSASHSSDRVQVGRGARITADDRVRVLPGALLLHRPGKLAGMFVRVPESTTFRGRILRRSPPRVTVETDELLHGEV